jgi:hypothetical protein
MALYNLARVTTATTGTGTITLGSAVNGFRTFAQAGVTNGATVTYSIRDGSQSEIGRGVYTLSGTTLTRSVLISTNSNAAINLSGSAEVMITAAAEDFTDAKARANHTGTQLAATISDLGTAAISIVTSRAALKELDTSVIRTVHLRLGIQSGTFQWWAGDYSAIIALDTVGGYAMKADAVASSAGAWLRVIDGDTMNALWFSVDNTGATATHGAVQVAIDVAATVGYKCYFPRGLYQLGAKLNHPEASHIIGDGKAAGIFSTKYTYFWANHSGDCFGNTNNSGSRSIRGVNFYRTQPTPGAGAYTPNTYGWEYYILAGQDIYFDDIHFHNVSNGIKAIGDSGTGAVCGRIHLNRITGQPLKQGFDFTHCLDVIWGDEIEFWVFFSNNANVVSYTRQNSVGMTLSRVDNIKFGRMFVYSYFRGLMLIHQGASGSLPTGTVSLGAFDVFGSDNTGIALLLNTGTDSATLHFNHVYGACNLADPFVTTEPFVWTLGNNARVYIGDLHGQYTNNALVAMNGTGNRIVTVLARSLGIAYSGGGVPEFNIAPGNTLTLLSSPITSAAVKYPAITGSGIIETPDWRSFTPTITANAGSFTTVSATGKCRRLPGKSVLFQFHITTTTVGTASGFTNVTLPYTNGSAWHFGASREIAATGVMCTATVAPSATALNVVTYNNTFATGSGSQVVGQVEYEAA